METLAEVLAPDHVTISSWGVDAREYHGLEGCLAARAEMSAVWGSWEQELERVLDAGEKGVVALLRCWSIVPTPNPSGGAFLEGVSCVSASACTAVGLYNTNRANRYLALAERWKSP